MIITREECEEFFDKNVHEIINKLQINRVNEVVNILMSAKHDPKVKNQYDEFCRLCNEYALLLQEADKKGKKDEADKITTAFYLGQITIQEAVDRASEVAYSYGGLRQGPVTNALACVSPKNSKVRLLFDYNNTAQIEKGSVKINFPNGMQTLFTAKVQSVFDALLLRQTKERRDTICFFVSWYMDLCGLKDRKETIKQIREALSFLFKISICFRWNERDYESQILRDNSFSKRDGVFVVRFNDTFLRIYSKEYGHNCMHLPLLIFRLNKNTNAFHYARKIAFLKHINSGEKNEDIVSIESLMKDSTKQADWDAVIDGNDRKLTQKIINPIERDLDEAKDIFTWHYCGKNGKELIRDQSKPFTKNEYRDMLIAINWRDRPAPLVRTVKPKSAKREYKTSHQNKKYRSKRHTGKGSESAPKSIPTGGKSVPIGG
jgi:hypothetical protein